MRAKFPLLLIVALIVSSIGSPVAAQQNAPALASTNPARLAPANEATTALADAPTLTALQVKAASTSPLKTTGGRPAAVQRLIDAGKGSLLVSTSRATGYARFVRMDTGSAGTLSALLGLNETAQAQSQAAAFLAQYGDAFGLTDGGASLNLLEASTDYLGSTRLLYRQTYKGVAVFAGLMLFHFNADGQLTAVNGVIVPDIALEAAPTLSAAAAADIASAHVAQLSAGQISTVLARLNVVKNNLYVYRLGLVKGVAGSSHLVYEVEINNHSTVREFVYVDAHTGKVVDQVSAIHDGLSRTVYSNTYTTTAIIWQEGDPLPYTGYLSDEVNNIITGTAESYNVFASTTGGRDSYDGAGADMEAIAHRSDACPNASWNGTYTSFCDGVTGDDTVTHEWGHAYTEYTHGLIYQWQSGALNESYSDIWGEVADLINGRGTDSPDVTRTPGVCTDYSPPQGVLQVNTPPAIAGDYPAFLPSGGPDMTNPANWVTQTVVLVNDGVGRDGSVTPPADSADATTSDGCTALVNAASVAGKIALVDRGTCSFQIKHDTAVAAGAVGVIVVNHQAGGGALVSMAGTFTTATTFVGYFSGLTVRSELANSPNATIRSTTGTPTEDSVRWLSSEDDPAFGGAIRDMWSPNCYADPDSVTDAYYQCDATDGGGVHTNSGVPNHAFALMVDGGTFNGITVTALGLTKTIAIYWRAQSVYQTPTTDFADHADALEQSCSDLVGQDIFEPSTSVSTSITSTVAISAGDCTELGDAIDAVEFRTPPSQCNFQPLLDPGAPALCAVGTGNVTTVFTDTLEVDPSTSWTISHTDVFSATALDWFWDNALPGGRSGSAFNAPDPADAGDCSGGPGDVSRVMYLASPVITLPVTTTVTRLAFEHYIATEPGYDGGNVKISVNGGPFTLVADADYNFNDYNINMQAAPGNTSPLAGQPGFSGTDGGSLFGTWGQSQVNLSNYASPGDTIQLRFEFGADGCGGNDGWYVDNPHVYYCDAESAAEIVVSPTTLESTQAPDAVVTQTLTISNTGATDLNWSAEEIPSLLASGVHHSLLESGIDFAALTRQSADRPASSAPSLSAPLVDVVQDGSFEAGSPNPYWDEFSALFGTPLCDAGCGGPGGRTGDWYAWFGGAGSGSAESGSLTQTVTIPADSDATLDFYLLLAASVNGTGNFTVTIDSTVVFTANETMTPTYGTDYTLVSLDVSAFADGNPHTLGFYEDDPAGPPTLSNFNAFVDDVSLNVDVPWLSLSPLSGTVSAGTSDTVDVVFNSTGLAPGVYTASVHITSNDGDTPLVTIPVTLTVQSPFTFIYLPIIRR